MVGLRERQKKNRHRRMLDEAKRLFSEVGYERASIESLAERAEVSIGTIYNYYEGKGDVLLAIVSEEGDQVFALGEKILEEMVSQPHRAIQTLLEFYVDHAMMYLDRETWRYAVATSIQQPHSPMGKRYTEVDERLNEQLARLSRRLVEQGAIDARVDIDSISAVLFNNMNMMFNLFLVSETMTLADLKSTLNQQNDAVLAACGIKIKPSTS